MATSHISSYFSLPTLLAASHIQNKIKKSSSVFFYLASVTRQKPSSQPRVLHCLLALSLLLVFLDCLWRYRQAAGKQAPGWIISCSSMPDGHIAATWRGNGKWHHYHSNTGTTFGAGAGFQRICHTLVHLPTGKTIMCRSLRIHSVDNYKMVLFLLYLSQLVVVWWNQ